MSSRAHGLGSPYLRGASGLDNTTAARRRHSGKGTAESGREHGLDLPVVIRCAHCPWTYSGTTREGRELFAQHRTEAHQ